MTFLSSAVWFVVAIGLLVTVHEFGHFWVARRLGVKVLKFSIGFGRPLLRWQRDEVEYCIAAIPLGGYVKMLDEAEGEVAPHERARAFNRQGLPVRIAVVCAGPLFNFLFAIGTYWAMFLIGVSGIKPLIGEVYPDSLAARSGLSAGHEVVAVDGQPVQTWQRVVERVIGATLGGDTLSLEVLDQERARRDLLTLPLDGVGLDELTQGKFFERLGIEPARVPLQADIAQVVADSPAERAGLLPGDRILAADDQTIDEWSQLVRHVQARPGVAVRLEIRRDGTTATVMVTPEPVVDDPSTGRIGVVVSSPPAEVVEAFYRIHSARERYGVGEGFIRAVDRTREMSLLTLNMLWKMVTLEVSVKNLSGPISIAQYAGISAQRGLPWFLGFLAIVSISLGILNLLPIPLLDGGHLMYYCIELLTGKPVSEQVQFVGQRLGISMLVGLMGLAFYNDLARLFG